MARSYATLGSDGMLTAAQRPGSAGLTKLAAQAVSVVQTSIAHGLSGTPTVVLITLKGATLAYVSAPSDGTNVYITAAGTTTVDIYVAL